jgi:hypothetical protein
MHGDDPAGIWGARVQVLGGPTATPEQCRLVIDELRPLARAVGDRGLAAELRGWLAQATAELRRLQRQPVSLGWAEVAEHWQRLGHPDRAEYAQARRREAESIGC